MSNYVVDKEDMKDIFSIIEDVVQQHNQFDYVFMSRADIETLDKFLKDYDETQGT